VCHHVSHRNAAWWRSPAPECQLHEYDSSDEITLMMSRVEG